MSITIEEKRLNNLARKAKEKLSDTEEVARKYANTVVSSWESGRELYRRDDLKSLVNAFKDWIFVCASRNATTVAKGTFKLFVGVKPNSKLLVPTRDIDNSTLKWLQSNQGLQDYLIKASALKEVTSHPFLELLKHPNPFMTKYMLLEMTSLFLELTGNSYWYVYRDKLGIPRQLWVIPSQNMYIVPSKTTFISGYIFKNGTDTVPFDVNEIIHFKFPNPHNLYYGMAPHASIVNELNTKENMDKFENALFSNNCRPEGVLSTDFELNDNTFKRVKEEWNQNYAGVNKAGKTAVLEKGLKFTPITIPPKDLTHIQGRKQYREIVAGVFGVPLPMLTPESSNLANCHDQLTEVLTEDGWKTYDMVNNHKIATYNSVTNSIEYCAFIRKFIYIYSGKMVKVVNNVIDFCVTPNHRLYISSSDGHGKGWKNFYFKNAGNIPKGTIKVLQSINEPGTNSDIETILISGVQSKSYKSKNELDVVYKMDDFVEFVGYMIAEGGILTKGNNSKNRYIATLSQKKFPENIDSCLKRLKIGGKSYITLDGVTRWNITGKRLITWLKENIGSDCYSKKIPRNFINNLSKRQLQILFNAMMLGDGSFDKRNNRNSGYYATVSKQLANDFMELSLKLGFKVTCSTNFDKRQNRQPCYMLHLFKSNSNTSTFVNPKDVAQVFYDGVIFSFEVPNGIYITKRNGKISIHGNSYVADRQYYSNTIDPRYKRLEGSINTKLMSVYDDSLFIAFDNPVPDDVEFKLREEVAHVKSGIRTPNEIRTSRGWDEHPDGDILLIPSNVGGGVGQGAPFSNQNARIDDEVGKEIKIENTPLNI